MLGAANGLLWWLSFPPVFFWPLALVSPVPLMYLGMRTRCGWRGAVGAVLGALPAWGITHWWILDISAAGGPALILYMAAWTGIAAWTIARVRRSLPWLAWWVMLPVVWIGVEYLRGEVVLNGYPWYLAGSPLVGATMLGAAAKIGGSFGVYGASMVSALASTMVLAALRARHKGWGDVGRVGAVLGAYLVIAALIGGPSGGDEAGVLKVAAVQTNVPQSNKDSRSATQRLQDFSTALRLTSEAAHAKVRPDVIAWPETMFPGESLTADAIEEERRSGLGFREINLPLTGWYDELMRLQRDLGVPMIVGSIAIDGLTITAGPKGFEFKDKGRFNSAFLVEDGTPRTERYDKIGLTPFGETMPYISNWKWLERQLLALGANGMEFDLGAGKLATRLDVPRAEGGPIRVATPICFEATMAGVVRKLAVDPETGAPAGLIINLTNDGWFSGSDWGRENHLLAARWRSVELGLAVVRAANTGISALILPDGRVSQQGPTAPDGDPSPTGARVAGVMAVEAPVFRPMEGGRTFYARHGDLIGRACMLLTLGMFAAVLGTLWLNRRANKQASVA